LRVFDSNGSGWIDPRDAVFSQLRLWSDRNHDGVSQSNELVGLSAQAIGRLGLEYKSLKRVDEFGNWFRYRGVVEQTTGRDVGRFAYDVYLTNDLPKKARRIK